MKTAETLESVKIPETVSDLHKIQKKTRRRSRRERIRRLEQISREASQQPLVAQQPPTIQEIAVLHPGPSQTVTNDPSELTKVLETAETLESVKIPKTVSDLHKMTKKTRRRSRRGRIRRLEQISREASRQPLVAQQPPTIQEIAVLHPGPSQTVANDPSELAKVLETAETPESVKIPKTVSDLHKTQKKTRRRSRRERIRRLEQISCEASQQPLVVQEPPTIPEIAVLHPERRQTVAKDPSGLTKALKSVKIPEIILELNKLPANDPNGSCVDNIFSGVPTLSVTEA